MTLKYEYINITNVGCIHQMGSIGMIPPQLLVRILGYQDSGCCESGSEYHWAWPLLIKYG